MDELAKLYVNVSGHSYRIKVFERMIGIECQQPHGDNRFYDRTEPAVYDGSAWNLQTISSLIAQYDHDQTDTDSIVHKMFKRQHDNPALLAFRLWKRMDTDGLTLNDLAAELGTTPEQVGRLALCRPPRHEAFEADVQTIAAAVPMDAAKLTTWLKRYV